jgi:hypothetical protein
VECKGTKSLIHPMGEVAYPDDRESERGLSVSRIGKRAERVFSKLGGV